MRYLILAIQFLTHLPTPQVRNFVPADMARAAAWFPLVGLIVGVFIAAAQAAGASINPWLGALAAVLAWAWITGCLHLDGLADLADALGAAHRDRERFLQVLRDPHLGSFGVVSIVLAITAKLVLLALLPANRSMILALILVPAWARLGPLIWSAWLPAIHQGMGERISAQPRPLVLLSWAMLLFASSLVISLPLALMPLAIAGWGLFLRRRLGGQCGDALGAGIEVLEIGGLGLLVVMPGLLRSV